MQRYRLAVRGGSSVVEKGCAGLALPFQRDGKSAERFAGYVGPCAAKFAFNNLFDTFNRGRAASGDEHPFQSECQTHSIV